MANPNHHEVYAIKYAENKVRTRGESFIFDTTHDVPHDMDYFIWVIRNEQQTILVDTGFDSREGARRDRPILLEPAQALAEIGIAPESVDTVIITHLHYDHAGGLEQFPNARFQGGVRSHNPRDRARRRQPTFLLTYHRPLQSQRSCQSPRIPNLWPSRA